ncbi:putative fucosyltransferase-like protein [Cucumis melo var. makuwa]|uniref:Putative fucosyltransferase-like protein n=1 Tax=Cucumis melo var. makuwa TaxID=1194695 RepID=A0A5D3CBG3_CUCMM|nr:putative fucosyltransferase-like protein [Cucumis melo var. makuwa]
MSSGAPMSAKKKWSNAMPLFIALVVVVEIIFLGHLDVAKNVAMVNSWADLFYRSPPPLALIDGGDDLNFRSIDGDRISEFGICEEWLEKEDVATYSRDFQKEPILVSGSDETLFCIDVEIHAMLHVASIDHFICKLFVPYKTFQEVDDNNHETLSLKLSKSVGLGGG